MISQFIWDKYLFLLCNLHPEYEGPIPIAKAPELTIVALLCSAVIMTWNVDNENIPVSHQDSESYASCVINKHLFPFQFTNEVSWSATTDIVYCEWYHHRVIPVGYVALQYYHIH